MPSSKFRNKIYQIRATNSYHGRIGQGWEVCLLRMKSQLHENFLKTNPTVQFPPSMLLEHLPYTIMTVYNNDERNSLLDLRLMKKLSVKEYVREQESTFTKTRWDRRHILEYNNDYS